MIVRRKFGPFAHNAAAQAPVISVIARPPFGGVAVFIRVPAGPYSLENWYAMPPDLTHAQPFAC